MEMDRPKACRTSPVSPCTGEAREPDWIRTPSLAAAALAILHREGRLQTAADWGAGERRFHPRGMRCCIGLHARESTNDSKWRKIF